MSTITVTPPKFNVGQTVKMLRADLYGCKTGEVVEVTRIYKHLMPNGTFDDGGLTIMETDIKGIQLPYGFDGDTITIHYPATQFSTARTRQYKSYSWVYAVKSKSMTTVLSEICLAK